MYAAFGVGGLLLRFALKAEFARGIGASLLVFAGLGLLIDGFAERRAMQYTQALEAAQRADPSTPPGTGLRDGP